MTGGGFVDDSPRTSFGFVVRGGSEGHLQFQLQAGDDRFHASTLSSFSVSGNTATWTASGSWNGVGGYALTVTVEDTGPASQGVRDRISIVIKAPNGSTVFATTGRLLGGNIVVH
ncbi:MAG TPA: post-COAP-1 domain-containing protein [Candidatus Limnocylindrales bacterium]|nr:post-COAP-1 domain-containing protein [Candidatus Limnocylindrales bacterium]